MVGPTRHSVAQGGYMGSPPPPPPPHSFLLPNTFERQSQGLYQGVHLWVQEGASGGTVALID